MVAQARHGALNSLACRFQIWIGSGSLFVGRLSTIRCVRLTNKRWYSYVLAQKWYIELRVIKESKFVNTSLRMIIVASETKQPRRQKVEIYRSCVPAVALGTVLAERREPNRLKRPLPSCEVVLVVWERSDHAGETGRFGSER